MADDLNKRREETPNLDELTSIVDRLHSLLHDDGGRGMATWQVAVYDLCGKVSEFAAEADNATLTQRVGELEKLRSAIGDIISFYNMGNLVLDHPEFLRDCQTAWHVLFELFAKTDPDSAKAAALAASAAKGEGR